MRIAYSCAGEGFGHASRMATLGPLLEARHELVYFVPNEIAAYLEGKIGPRRLERLPHFRFAKRGDRVRLLATILQALPLGLALPFEILALAARLSFLKVDAVVSDFDPFLPWAAVVANLPILQINHPGIVQRYPKPSLSSIMASIGACFLEGPWNERLHVSFYGGDLGPIIRPELRSIACPDSGPAQEGGFALLNLKEGYRPLVLPVLEELGLAYRLFPGPRGDFAESLASCSCVLSSAGHQIIAEALSVGKPILVLPQKGQWEQELNARMLVRSGKGASTTVERIREELPLFLSRLEAYREAPLPRGFAAADCSRRARSRIEAFLGRCAGKKYSWRIAPQALRF